MAKEQNKPNPKRQQTRLRRLCSLEHHVHHSLILTSIICASVANATQDLATGFCEKFPQIADCEGSATTCGICHAGPPALNFYGADLKDILSKKQGLILNDVIEQINTIDSDGDGVDNLSEIDGGGSPGNPQVQPLIEQNLVYDFEIAFKRMKAIYCGEAAVFDELEQISNAQNPREILHTKLNACLNSDYWKNEALHRLADRKIQPLAAVGFGGNVVIGDYRWDYRLFSYVMSGDRDVRELLSAQYHVNESGNPIQGPIAREEPFQLGQRIVIAGGQPLATERRAGMMTTQWFLSSFTMFAELPRNTAAQVYRAYLGLDIAKGEGLIPVAGEPRDVDERRVAERECAVCHSTLDPLAYAFSTYKGIEVGPAVAFGNPIGTYDASRTPWESDGQIFGQQTSDLLQWAEVARNSENFLKNIAHMMFEQVFDRSPLEHEIDEFTNLWQAMPQEGYSVNKLVHNLVDTLAFGGRAP